MQETEKTWVWTQGWEDLLEEEMATDSSVLAWKIPSTEEPCRLQSMGSQGVRHDWAEMHMWLFYHVVLVSAVQQVNQLFVHICPLRLGPPSPPHPTPLGHHTALSWAPCAIKQVFHLGMPYDGRIITTLLRMGGGEVEHSYWLLLARQVPASCSESTRSLGARPSAGCLWSWNERPGLCLPGSQWLQDVGFDHRSMCHALQSHRESSLG